MKTLRLVCGLLFLFAGCGVAQVQAAATGKTDDAAVLLQLHFHANDVRNIKVIMEQKIKTTFPNQPEVTINQTIGFGYRMTVISVDDKGNAETKMTYRSVLWKQNRGQQGSSEYDSAHPPATVPDEAKGFAALIDQSVNITFAPDGQVLKTSGVDEMLKKMVAKLGLAATAATDMEQSLKAQFGDDAMRETMEQMTRIYPEKPVKVGDAWSRHVELGRGLAVIMDNRYKLTDRSKGIANVSIKSSCKPNLKAPGLEIGPTQIHYELEGEQNGTMEIEESSGWMLHSKMTQKFSGTMHLQNPMLPQPIDAPISIDSLITMTTE